MAPHAVVLAPGILVAAHDMSMWWIGCWDNFRLIYFLQDSSQAHRQRSEMLRGVLVGLAITLRLSFEGPSVSVRGNVIVLALRA